MASRTARAAQQPFFKCMANEAKSKSMANPREAAKIRLIKARIPFDAAAGQGFIPRNGEHSHSGSPKNRKLGIHHRPMVSAKKLTSTGMGRRNRPMIEPSHREDVAGEIMFNS